MTVIIKTNGIDAINQALKVLTDEIDRLRKEIGLLKANPVSVAVVSSIAHETQTVSEAATLVVDQEPEAEVFDWKNSDDESTLIKYAESIGIDVDSRATPNSLKRKIKNKLGE